MTERNEEAPLFAHPWDDSINSTAWRLTPLAAKLEKKFPCQRLIGGENISEPVARIN
jgi:hypothetical protein